MSSWSLRRLETPRCIRADGRCQPFKCVFMIDMLLIASQSGLFHSRAAELKIEFLVPGGSCPLPALQLVGFTSYSYS